VHLSIRLQFGTRDAAILQTEIPPFASMSSEATTSKPEDSAKQTSEIQKEGDQTPHLSVLEEDDEFEEFAVQGERTHRELDNAGTPFSSTC